MAHSVKKRTELYVQVLIKATLQFYLTKKVSKTFSELLTYCSIIFDQIGPEARVPRSCCSVILRENRKRLGNDYGIFLNIKTY